MLIYFLISVIALLVASFIFGKKNLPPGPYGLPIVGYSPFLGKNVSLTLMNLRKKYGNVVRVSFGITPVVILNDYTSMKEAFVKKGGIFSGRPPLFIANKLFGKNDIIFTDGPAWKQQKRLSLQILRDFGFGQTSLETSVMEQVDKLSAHLATKNGTPVQINAIFFAPVMNVIWGICAGKTFDIHGEQIRDFKECFDRLTSISNTDIINYFPMLRHIVPGGLGYDKAKIDTDIIRQFLHSEVATHIENFKETDMKDFTDHYWAKILSTRKAGQETEPVNRSGLVGAVFDLFLAGADTTGTTLAWAILYVALRRDIQRKIQDELDKHVSHDSYISPASKALLPYTEATLLEIQRYATIIPLGVPHRATKDATLMGYDIPQDTTVFANLYAVHYDKEYWGDPETFRPERFLDENGEVKRHECFVPFSAGPRLCLGESLAKLELFLFFTSLLRRFTFELDPSKPKPSEEADYGGLLKPQPYSCIVKCR